MGDLNDVGMIGYYHVIACRTSDEVAELKNANPSCFMNHENGGQGGGGIAADHI